MILLTCKIIMAINGDSDLSEGATYLTAYYAILFESFSYSVIEAQAAIGSKFLGAKKYGNTYLCMKQCIWITSIFYLTMVMLPSFFADSMIRALGVGEKAAELSQAMIFWSLPGVFLRVVNGSFKTFIQNHGKIRELGYDVIKVFVVFIGVCYLVLEVLKLRVIAIGVIIMAYELVILVICLWYIYSDMDSDKVDSSNLELTDGISALNWEIFKNFLLVWPTCLVFDSVTFFIATTGVQSDIIAANLYQNFVFLSSMIAGGFTVQPKNDINRLLGRKEGQKAYQFYKRYFFVYLIISLLFAMFFAGVIYLAIFFNVFNDPHVTQTYKEGLFFISIKLGLSYINTLMMKTTTAIENQHVLSLAELPNYTRIPVDYLMIIYFNFGCLGVFIVDMFLLSLMTPVLKPFIQVEEFTKFDRVGSHPKDIKGDLETKR